MMLKPGWAARRRPGRSGPCRPSPTHSLSFPTAAEQRGTSAGRARDYFTGGRSKATSEVGPTTTSGPRAEYLTVYATPMVWAPGPTVTTSWIGSCRERPPSTLAGCSFPARRSTTSSALTVAWVPAAPRLSIPRMADSSTFPRERGWIVSSRPGVRPPPCRNTQGGAGSPGISGHPLQVPPGTSSNRSSVTLAKPSGNPSARGVTAPVRSCLGPTLFAGSETAA